MKSNLKGFAGDLLFALDIFIVFLLAFDSRMSVPDWLQPLGRMHPMLLHFPIVILMLAMVLEFFRFKPVYQNQEFYQQFTSSLLLFGALSSAVTVIMGLLLAKEPGYEGASLQWHRWTGVSIVFLISLIYWSRSSRWYTAGVTKIGAVITSFCLIFAGHFGATLTHGENFILEPVMAQAEEKVPVDQALVFKDVIRPIFEAKCQSCHNADKAKGGLVLEDERSILKGGKTGKLFVAGKPQQSLLLQRIHLPVDNKKHMSPKGKTQLSEDEVSLLTYWIKGTADFKKKVIELPANDSLRMLATAFLAPADPEEDQFDFPAVDKEVVSKLNNNYRIVYPLAEGSPALAADFFNQRAYTSSSLSELTAVKTQIVALELNKMPVKDADLKTVGQLVNLEKLDLNFTDITGKGLKELASLKQLKSLSLAGTRVTYSDLQPQLHFFKALRTLVIWNTPLKETEIQQLRKENRQLNIISGYKDDGSKKEQLIPPQLKNRSFVFSTAVPLELKHPINGVKIRYTTDGSVPDSISSPVFEKGTVIRESTTIKTRAFKEGWFGSNVAVFNFYKSTYKPDSTILISPLHPDHSADGARTFFDGQAGDPGNSDQWAGVQNRDLELLLEFKKEVPVSSVTLNTLLQPDADVFPPMLIEIWGGTSAGDMRFLGLEKPELVGKGSGQEVKSIGCKFRPQKICYLKVVAKPLKQMPAWHKNKGKPALLLVDEILLN